jgi:hypothetical protein
MTSLRQKRPQSYALERLYIDQAHDFVKDVIAPVIAWLTEDLPSRSHVGFELKHSAGRGRPKSRPIDVTRDLEALKVHDVDVAGRVERIRKGRSALSEKLTELAGYGLALVATSVFLPGRQVVAWRKWSPPDLLLDVTPERLRGVEAAARSSGGWGALRAIAAGSPGRPGKRAELRGLPDVVEAHLSLWCRSPHLAMMIRVKP